MKQNLNVNKVLDLKGFFYKKNLDLRKMATELGPKLFPNVKFPRNAFLRAVNGKGELTANQVSFLAQEFKCDIAEFYSAKREEVDDLM